MTAPTYPPPVAALFTRGNPHPDPPDVPPMTDEEFAAMEEQLRAGVVPVKHEPFPLQSPQWPDYLAGGLELAHVPDLLRVLRDEDLWELDEDDPAVYTQFHAWRALGQLRAEEAIRPLIGLLERYDDWDYFREEVPEVLGLIGPAALAPLATVVANPLRPLYVRVTASAGLTMIARMHPEARDAAIAAITAAIEGSLTSDAAPDESETLNGFLVSDLIDLEATETLPLITRALAADRLDESITGDLEDIEIAFGVREQRDTPRPRYNILPPLPTPALPPWDPSAGDRVRTPNANKGKRKRQIAKQSRRVNRKKK